jgi:hypothetical protein
VRGVSREDGAINAASLLGGTVDISFIDTPLPLALSVPSALLGCVKA